VILGLINLLVGMLRLLVC